MDSSLHDAAQTMVLYFLFFGVPSILLVGTAIWIWSLKKIWQESGWSPMRRGITFGLVVCTWLLGALIYAVHRNRKGVVVLAMICFAGLALAAMITEPWQSWLDKRVVVGVESPTGAFLGNVYFEPQDSQTSVKVLYSCREGEGGYTATLQEGDCKNPGSVRYPLKMISDCTMSLRFADELTRIVTVPVPLKELRKRDLVVVIRNREDVLEACGSLSDAYDL